MDHITDDNINEEIPNAILGMNDIFVVQNTTDITTSASINYCLYY